VGRRRRRRRKEEEGGGGVSFREQLSICGRVGFVGLCGRSRQVLITVCTRDVAGE